MTTDTQPVTRDELVAAPSCGRRGGGAGVSDNVIGTLTPETFRLRRERAQRLWDAGEMDMQTYALVTTVLLFAQRIDETEAILRDVAAIYFRFDCPACGAMHQCAGCIGP